MVQEGKMDRPRFEDIYAGFHGKIVRYLTRLVGEADAEDLAQETFVKVGQALEGFRGDAQLHTWVYKIATNTAFDKLRSPSLRETSHDPASIESIVSIKDVDFWAGRKRLGVEQQAIREEMSSCVRDVISQLPNNYLTAIVLSDLEGFKDNEIAEVLGLTLSATKIRLHRARARLKKDLSSYCVFYRNEENELACDRKADSDQA
jgi:RNA polymerase sigma-70 factor, ECF subfamily